ncbi:MAG: amino acid racemase [Acidobacteriota bacterium]
MTVARHIGIVAVSAEGAALCYRTICSEAAATMGVHNHPQITMHTFPLADYMRCIDADRWDEAGRLMLASAAKLVQTGARFLICPDNTLHQGLNLVRTQCETPWLHIAEEVAALARTRGFRRLAILGTRYLMEGPVYPAALAVSGIAYETPDAQDRLRINQVIFDELVCGRIEETSRAEVQTIIRKLAERGCDAVVLGCTELPLLISEEDSPLPVLDSTRILARAALREATREA